MPATVLLDADEVAAQVRRLGAEIAADHPEGVVLVGVLKGALLFVADLARAIVDIPVDIDFIAISRFAPDSGRVKILHDLATDISDRDVVLVEDMVDTGLTLAYLMGQLEARGPRRLAACTLLDRPARRIVPHDIRYRGLVLDDEFVLGYGLHARSVSQPAVRRGRGSRCRRRDPGGVCGPALRPVRGVRRPRKGPLRAGGSLISVRTEAS